MKIIWMLAAANLRKNKGQTFSILILILISIMLLNIGLTMFGMGDFFLERAEELNTPHWVTWEVTEKSVERYEFVRNFPAVTEAEDLFVLVMNGNIEGKDTGRSGVFFIAPYSEAQRMNPPSLIGDSLPLTDNAIYIPYFMTLDGGVTIGDEINMVFGSEKLSFTLAGGTEEIMLGASMSILWRFYVSEARFQELCNQFPDNTVTLITARLENSEEAFLLTNAYGSEFAQDENYMQIITLPAVQSLRTDGAILPAMLVAVFSLILLVVGVIVIRFRIINGIEEGMVNIGVQKAMGYRNKQIIYSIIMQFGSITLVGGVLGILASRAALRLVVGLVEPLFGLRWHPAFHTAFAVISLVMAMVIVLVYSFITAIRIRKLHPLTALRGGISTHNFKRNHFALDKFRSPLILSLALKTLFMSKKQSIMISLIIVAVSFTSVAGIATYYNIVVNDTAFIRAQMGDIPDVWLEVHDADDIAGIRERIEARPEVLRVEYGDSSGSTTDSTISVVMNDVVIRAAIIDDFAEIADYTLVDGRFPLHDNEIVISAIMLQAMGLHLGDWVTVTSNDGKKSETFMVTGSTQSAVHDGMMSVDSLARVGVNIQFDTLSIRLSPSTDTDAFIEGILAEDGAIILEAVNMRGMVDEMTGSMKGMLRFIVAAILTFVATVVILVLYLVVRTTIYRRRREIGIQRAMGFTTFQLMNQIAFGFTPSILFGAAVGAVIGYLRFDAIFTMILREAGVVKVNLPVPLLGTIGMCAALILLSYAVSMFVAWRIRKISAYALVSE